MLSMPFNSSTPILYYNKDVFEKAGLDPRHRAQDLGGSRGILQEDHGLRRCQVRLHHRLDLLGAARELLGLAQPAHRHARERLRRHGHRVHRQRPDAGQALGEPQEVAGCRRLPVWRPRRRRRRSAEVLRAGMRHLHELLGLARRRASPTPRTSRSASACCPTMPTSQAPAELDHRRRHPLGAAGP